MLTKMVKCGHMKHEVDTRIICCNAIENDVDADAIRNVYVLPPNIRRPSLQRDGRVPAIHADHFKIPAQFDTNCGAEKAGRARNDDDTIIQNGRPRI